LAVLGKQVVTLEARARGLFLKLPNVLHKFAEALVVLVRACKHDVIGHTLPEQALPLICCDVSVGVQVRLPYLLKSLYCHMQSFLARAEVYC
jgi:hypothetical protein